MSKIIIPIVGIVVFVTSVWSVERVNNSLLEGILTNFEYNNQQWYFDIGKKLNVEHNDIARLFWTAGTIVDKNAHQGGGAIVTKKYLIAMLVGDFEVSPLVYDIGEYGDLIKVEKIAYTPEKRILRIRIHFLKFIELYYQVDPKRKKEEVTAEFEISPTGVVQIPNKSKPLLECGKK